ncbi:uncharacterized protein TNCV_381951 [Trichonephila clavipes]|nr:uncharacterized protein TNCV_381951 [Trichonephila clavipes]
MTGHLKGFVAHDKELNEDILVTHCFLHQEALVTKFLPSDLKIVLEQCVKMVNYIKSRPLKSRLFSKLCQAMEAKYESLLLHTETLSEAKQEEFLDDTLIYAKSLCEELEISFEPPRRIRRKHIFGDGSKDVQLSYEDDLSEQRFLQQSNC